MKSLMLLMAALTITSVSAFSQHKADKKDTSQHYQIYTCPMHDSVTAKQPGNCPICGMKLQLSNKEQMKTAVTKTYACPVHTDVTSGKPGKCSKCGMSLTLSSKEKMKVEAINNYTCPMHSNVKSDKPGTCPTCGMKLTQTNKKTASGGK
jgi:hypothetical protein